MITRFLVVPRVSWVDWPGPMSWDTFAGKTFEVQEIHERKVIRDQGVYWNLQDQTIEAWTTITVKAVQDNKVIIE